MPVTGPEAGVFGPDEIESLAGFYAQEGYATLRGGLDATLLGAAEEELADAQHRLAEGRLDARHGTAVLDDPDATVDGLPFAHYVCFATWASPRADALVHHPVLVEVARHTLGNDAWLLDYEQFGVVYQDARPGPLSGYSRIGWHTDHQSGPHLDIWPGMAFTLHFDPTSPANGFLRVLPGSHRSGTAGIPLGFERVPARSPSTRNGATCCSIMPTSGTPQPGPRPTTRSPSAGTSAVVGTVGPDWPKATARTTS